MKAKILVIYDLMVSRMAIINFLSSTGDYKFLEASDGQEAIKLFEAHHPEIVIIDLNIPGMRAEEVIRSIKRNPTKTKVIALTSNNLERAGVAKAAGCDDFLRRPFHLLKLQAAVEKLLHNN